MIGEALFTNLNSEGIAKAIRSAEFSVCYAAPGIQIEAAKAISEVASRIGPELITTCLDFDERVFRMGYGALEAVRMLRDAGVSVNSMPGLRTGLVIVDREGFIFTPTALFLESEDGKSAAPNAMRLSKDQSAEALARLSPAAKAIALALAATPEERERVKSQAVEIESKQVEDASFSRVKKSLDEAPPVRFDVARQVHVFNAYLQYVELKLEGAALQHRKVSIPPSILKLGGAKNLEGRLKTTFDLIEKDGELSSKALEYQLNEIRKDFTPSLGKKHGRVVLKSAKPLLEERLKSFRDNLASHQISAIQHLQNRLDASREQVVKYYLNLVIANPPDDLRAQCQNPGPHEARNWLDKQLKKVFPEAASLTKKMQLEVSYKDVTFETLNHDNFIALVKDAFPLVDWEKTYSEFRAAGESRSDA